MIEFNALHWFYRADDGRVFSCSRQVVVAEDDATYVAFSAGAAPGGPLPWPRDASGAQTDAALDEVLAPLRLSTRGPVREAYGDDLITALSDAELTAMSAGTLRDQRMLSAQRVPFRATDDIIVRLAGAMKIDPAAWLARVPA